MIKRSKTAVLAAVLRVFDHQKETIKTMAVWGESLKQNGNSISAGMRTDLGDEYNAENEQMAYRDGMEIMPDINPEAKAAWPSAVKCTPSKASSTFHSPASAKKTPAFSASAR